MSELQLVTRSLSARAFAERHAREDVFLLEPWDRERDYARGVHGEARWIMIPRELNQPVPVGRDARALVQIDHAAVSRLHAVLAWTGDAWKAMDRSSNGSWLNGERLPPQQAVVVPYGAVLRLGRAFVLRILSPEALHELLRSGSAVPGGAAPPPPTDPRAETWRFPAVQEGLLLQDAAPPAHGRRVGAEPVLPPHVLDEAPAAPAEGQAFAPPAALAGGGFELDFDFADAPPVLGDEAFVGGEAAPAPPPPPPPPPQRPRLPANPSASPDPEFTDEIEFDFGSKFDRDGRGGFA